MFIISMLSSKRQEKNNLVNSGLWLVLVSLTGSLWATPSESIFMCHVLHLLHGKEGLILAGCRDGGFRIQKRIKKPNSSCYKASIKRVFRKFWEWCWWGEGRIGKKYFVTKWPESYRMDIPTVVSELWTFAFLKQMEFLVWTRD